MGNIENIEKEKEPPANEIEALARRIWSLSRDRLIVLLRFLDVALSSLKIQMLPGADKTSCDGAVIYYDPLSTIRLYKKNQNSVTRLYLHILLHCIFGHSFNYGRTEQDVWDVAADMAVEHAVMTLGLAGIDEPGDDVRREVLAEWNARVCNARVCDANSRNEKAVTLTADRLYRALVREGLGATELFELGNLFWRDSHERWMQTETLEISEAQWKKISERMKAELKSFSQDKSDSATMLQNLEEATRERHDYGDFLRRFCVAGEDMTVNDDEFDYVYYTYGLSLYGNLPLVEALEYKDVNKIKEFVVAIDTSGSCRGSTVQAFLEKTYNILKSSENFFRKVNIHIIQCDSDVRSDTKITDDDEFEEFMRTGHLEGFGSTDFRPVFTYVGQAIERGEFENLKGLIYFTDGYGIFPEHKPPHGYDTAFVFLGDYDGPSVPPWAIKVVMEEEP